MMLNFANSRLVQIDARFAINSALSICLLVLLGNEFIDYKCGGDMDSTLINSTYYQKVTEYNSSLGRSVSRRVVMYNRHLPVIFVGGVPRSGTTLMRVMLDAHPQIRCGEETHIVPWMLAMRHMLRADVADDDVLDSAVRSSMLEVILRHGPFAQHLCNKDPIVLVHAAYVKSLLPNSKFILMVRDARATVHSIISRNITIGGFDRSNYERAFVHWNEMFESFHNNCAIVGKRHCMPVYYEELVLHPERTMRHILAFLGIGWNPVVLQHQRLLGKKIRLSRTEESTSQVVKPVNLEALSSWFGHIPSSALEKINKFAPMMARLGYDTKSHRPSYGEPDADVEANTRQIQGKQELWRKLAKWFSDLV